MNENEAITVGEAARLAGITVRTLHHYDAIGLVSPASRSEAGYRLYTHADVERLQEVLLFREPGIALDEIKRIVDEPGYRRGEALRRQKELLLAGAGRLLAMVDAVDRAIAAEETGVNMTPKEMLEVFGDFDPTGYEQEAKERWGDTEAFAESSRRTARYTKQDWQALSREAGAINEALMALMADGVPPSSPEAMELAKQHRAHISRWFYECTPEVHVGLAAMYVEDPRFRENIDKAGEGLAEYLAAAITANARR